MKKREIFFLKNNFLSVKKFLSNFSFFDNFFLNILDHILFLKNYNFFFTLNNSFFFLNKENCKFFILSFCNFNDIMKNKVKKFFFLKSNSNFFYYNFFNSQKNDLSNYFFFNLVDNFFFNNRKNNIFILNKNTVLNLVEYYFFLFKNCEPEYRVFNKFILYEKSKINYLKYCNIPDKCSFLCINNVIQKKSSEFLNLNFIFNNYKYNDIFNFFINNSKTRSEVNNFFISFKNSITLNNFYYTSCFNQANIYNKSIGLCCNNSFFIFNSNVFLSIFSKNNFIKQVNNNLFFGNAVVSSTPKYSIKNSLNEVFHENTSNSFNSELLFYLHSRGFDIISIYKFYLNSILISEFKIFINLNNSYFFNFLKEKINFFYDNEL